MRTSLPVALTICALAFAGVAAGGGTTLKLKASATGLMFDKKVLKAKVGKVTILMKNLSPLRHNVAVKGHGLNKKGKVVGRGGTSKVVVTLKQGTYVFYCSVPGHEVGGMKGKLIVT